MSCTDLSLSLLSLLLLYLQQQRSVDMRQHTSKRNSRPDQRVQLLVTADRELQMAGSDALDLEILGRVASQFKDFGGEIFEDGSEVDGGFGTDARAVAGYGAEVALYTAAGELDRNVLVRNL